MSHMDMSAFVMLGVIRLMTIRCATTADVQTTAEMACLLYHSENVDSICKKMRRLLFQMTR